MLKIQELNDKLESYTLDGIKNIELDELNLSSELIKSLLVWLDNNPYKCTEERIRYALEIYLWCYRTSRDLEFYAHDMRKRAYEDACARFNISRNGLAALEKKLSESLIPGKRMPFIVAIEGIDGSGKTVQTDLLEQYFVSKGKNVLNLSFPVYDSFYGQEIGRLLSGRDKYDATNVDPKSMSLWYALDRKHRISQVDLYQYDVVVINRYTLSSVVYQGVRSDCSTSVEDWIFELEHKEMGLPVPDLYIVLDVDHSSSRGNVSSKGTRDYVGDSADVYESSSDIINKSRDKYLQISKSVCDIAILNCMSEDGKLKSIDDISKDIINIVCNI